MKVKSAFEDPRSGEMLMPGQDFDTKGLDEEEQKKLKEQGYIADGSGYKAGEKPDLDKMDSSDLVALAKAKGIDTGQLRNRQKLINAINTKEGPKTTPPPGDQKAATITFGPKVSPTVEDRVVSEEDRAKELADRTKARADSEKSMAQSAAAKEKAAEAVKQADAASKAAGKGAPPERKSASGSAGERK